MTNRSFPARASWVALIAVAALSLSAANASATTVEDEKQGAAVLQEFESGKLSCADASDENFERVGEYVMGRMLGSPGSHDAMDEVMSRMMGSGSESRVHEAMGRRFADCGGGQLPAGFGRMMGAVNAMGMMGGGMMGGLAQGGRSYGSSSSMMDGYWNWNESAANDENFNGPSAAAMIGMMAVLIGAVAVAVLFLARRRPGGGPLDTLEQRFARGELSAEEYQERKRLLGGS